MIDKNRKAIFWLVLFEVIAGVLLIYRVCHGVELTDEAFYSALGWRIVAGNTPIKEMWEMQQTSYILLYPFYKLYALVFGTTGIQLALRFFDIALSIAAVSPLYVLSKRFLSTWMSLLICTCYVVYAPFSIISFGYNNILYHIAMLATTFMLSGYLLEKSWYFLLAGISMALMAFCYPTQVISCLTLLVVLIVILYIARYKHIKHSILWFAAGGGGMALIIIIMLICICGIQNLQIGINEMMGDAAYASSKTFLEYLNILEKTFKYCLMPFSFPLFLAYFSITALCIALVKDKIFSFILIAIYPVMAYYAALQFTYSGTHMSGNIQQMFSYAVPLMFLFKDIRRNKIAWAILWFQYIPTIVFYSVISISSAGSYMQANHVMIIHTIAAIELFVILIRGTEVFEINTRQILVFTFVCLLVATSFINYYKVVYRDGSLETLTSKVESGPFAGIYTTESRKEYIENTYSLMQDMQVPGKSACVLFRANYAYLMLDQMIPCSPALWGIYDGVNNEESFLRYFRLIETPDYIYVVEPADGFEMNITSSSWDSVTQITTKLANYIESNYVLEEINSKNLSARIMKFRRNE